MSRKFLTFLGTTSYSKACYTLGDKAFETSFVQMALLDFLGPFDESFIFVTEDAKKKNWEALSQEMKQCGKDAIMKLVDIPAGKNEQEIWEIFSTIRSRIGGKDVVVFDTTHSFRSIPILTLACIQYMRSLESVQLERIVYGAWEAREMDASSGISPKTPVFDLTPFVKLMDWSYAISEFSKYGHLNLLNELVSSDDNVHLMSKKLQTNLRKMVKDMLKLQQAILTCRGRTISEGKLLTEIMSNSKQLKKNPQELPQAFQPLLEKLEAKLVKLEGRHDIPISNEARFGFGAVEWCLSHGLIQQAYTIFQESVLTHFCQLAGLDYREKKDRELSSQSARTFNKVYDDWFEEAKGHREIVETIHKKAGCCTLAKYNSLSDNRNDINHMKIKSTVTPEKLTEQISEAFSRIVESFSEIG